MDKNSIKKLIVAIVFVVLLVMFFLVGKNLNDNKINNEITIVKSIINEKYDSVNYKKNSKYIYTMLKEDIYIYNVYDLYGNKLYNIKSDKELNIITVMKNYYIVYNDSYHLYDSDNNELTSGKTMEALNDYLIMVDKTVIDINNKKIFDDVHVISSYNNQKNFNINNYYLVDKKGNVLLENTFVEKEIKTNNRTDYLIIKQNNKYYTFFTGFNKIIGDEFDSYYQKKNVYIKNDNGIYMIYRTGFRKKISDIYISNDIKNNYILEEDNLINNKYLFVTHKKTNNTGIININTKKFIKIKKGLLDGIVKINNDYYILNISDNYYVYNLNSKKIIYSSKSKIKDVLIYDKYISFNNKHNYVLVDKKNEKIYESDKQIVVKNGVIKAGRVNDEFYLFDTKTKKTKLAKKIIINNNDYYLIKNTIYSKDLKKKYSSDKYISYSKNSIVIQKNNTIYFYDVVNNKTYKYKMNKNDEITTDYPVNNIIILENENNIKVVNLKGNLIKTIRKKNIKNYYENDNGKVILITVRKDNNKIYEGSYLAE